MSSTGPTVTVLIDTYNYARFVGRAIESALQQEYDGPPIQVLVVDDGSTDDTTGAVERFGSQVEYLAKSNGGQASALNVGLREAWGEIICLLDGDDYFYPGKVQQVADAFRDRPEVGLVYDEFDIVDSAGTSLHKVFPEPTWTGYRIPPARIPYQLRSLILLGHPWTCITSAMSVRHSVVADLHIPEAVFLHSPDLFLGHVLPFMAEVAIIESSHTAYVFHGQNVGLYRSSAVNRSMYQQQMECIRRYVEERFAVHFVRYGGRGLYEAPATERRATTDLNGVDVGSRNRAVDEREGGTAHRPFPTMRWLNVVRCAPLGRLGRGTGNRDSGAHERPGGQAREPASTRPWRPDGGRDRPVWRSALVSRRHGDRTGDNDETGSEGGTAQGPFPTTVVSHDRGRGRGSVQVQWAEFVAEYRQIAAADVDQVIKRRCRAQLVAGVLLPDVVYGALRDVRGKQRQWRNRQLRRRIAEARQ